MPDDWRMEQPDLLLAVQTALKNGGVDLVSVSKQSGINYDTLRRIKRGACDPGYSKVQRLASVLGIRYTIRLRKPTPTQQTQE